MELNFRGGNYSCITVIICGFSFCTLSKEVFNRLTQESTVVMPFADGTDVFLIDSS